jgi:hypothetical protein
VTPTDPQQLSSLSPARERQWIAGLREQGVKAAHPDDGWVNRDEHKIHLAYPQFDDGLEVGDLLALGWPWTHTRLVRVTGQSDNRFAVPFVSPWYWHFEDTGMVALTGEQRHG